MLVQDDTANLLLAALSPPDCSALTEHGVVVDLVRGHDLALAGDSIEYCWFPLSGLASVIATDRDDKEAEVGVIGCDGMVNGSVIFGTHHSPMRIWVQIAGSALRVDKRVVVAATRDRNAIFKLIAEYNHALAVQAAFSALAYAQYTLPQRLARWALMCADRVGDGNVDLTHEALSIMLGVRRAGVTVAIHALTAKGAIAPRRGGFSIIDRPVLMQIAGAGYQPSESQRSVQRYPPTSRNGVTA